MKYCNHCGEQLRFEEATATEKSEERFDDYVTGIFWITVFGLGLILGGMVLMKEVLHFSQGLIKAYLALSSTTFLIVFGIHLWQIIRMTRGTKKANEHAEEEPFDTNKLAGAKSPGSLEGAVSITENTTHRLETIPKANVKR